MEQINLDSIDEKIINEIISNSKIPLRSLAAKLGISFVTVLNRIKKLTKYGIIKNYAARIDFEKIGFQVHVIIEIKIAKGRLFELEKRIARNKNVYGVYDTTGEYDATVIAKFKSTRTMDNFLKDLQKLDFVVRTNTKLVLNTIKEDQIRI